MVQHYRPRRATLADEEVVFELRDRQPSPRGRDTGAVPSRPVELEHKCEIPRLRVDGAHRAGWYTAASLTKVVTTAGRYHLT